MTEILIVVLGFSVVGSYMLCWRHFLNRAEAEDQAAARSQPRTNGKSRSDHN